MDTFYFSHDYTARSDDKIKQLIRRHGMTGYGVYWAIIEDLYQNANALRIDCDGIAYDLRADCEMVRSVIFDFELFVHDNEKFGSLSVQKRLDKRNDKSAKARESANRRWNHANALRVECESNAIKESKVKESKEKESKEDNTFFSPPAQVQTKRKVFVIPSLDEIKDFAEKEMIGSLDAPEDFKNHYDARGWVMQKTPMKDWKAAFRNWAKKEKNGTYQRPISGQPTGETKQQRSERLIEEWGSNLDEGRRKFAALFGGTES